MVRVPEAVFVDSSTTDVTDLSVILAADAPDEALRPLMRAGIDVRTV